MESRTKSTDAARFSGNIDVTSAGEGKSDGELWSEIESWFNTRAPGEIRDAEELLVRARVRSQGAKGARPSAGARPTSGPVPRPVGKGRRPFRPLHSSRRLALRWLGR